jgi:hypothetical protein
MMRGNGIQAFTLVRPWLHDLPSGAGFAFAASSHHAGICFALGLQIVPFRFRYI